jgi:hypothetical protein
MIQRKKEERISLILMRKPNELKKGCDLLDEGIFNHIVLGIGEHIRGTFLGDGAKFDAERVPSFLKVSQRMPISTRAIKVLSATENRAAGQVQPEIVGLIAPLTLPTLWRDLHAIVQLHKTSSVLALHPRLSHPNRGVLLFVYLFICLFVYLFFNKRVERGKILTSSVG